MTDTKPGDMTPAGRDAAIRCADARFQDEPDRTAPVIPEALNAGAPGHKSADREHLTELNPCGVDRLREWLARPDGALSMGRVTFEAVAGGGILVRTKPYTAVTS